MTFNGLIKSNASCRVSGVSCVCVWGGLGEAKLSIVALGKMEKRRLPSKTLKKRCTLQMIVGGAQSGPDALDFAEPNWLIRCQTPVKFVGLAFQTSKDGAQVLPRHGIDPEQDRLGHVLIATDAFQSSTIRQKSPNSRQFSRMRQKVMGASQKLERLT
jgi:hypothetical protein